jgi:membrane protease subunit HflK
MNGRAAGEETARERTDNLAENEQKSSIWEDEGRGRFSLRSDMSAGLPRVRRLGRLFLVLLLAMYILSGIYVVQPDERGVVTRFGRVIADDIQPGIHYRTPWPVERVFTPQVTSIKRMSVGYRIMDRVRGVSPTSRDAQFVTGDENIIEAQMLVQYIVKDASDYLFSVEEPHWLVRKVCESVLTERVAEIGVDEILTTAKLEVESDVKAAAQVILDSYGAGIDIVAAHIQEVTPPREVADAFRDVASAREDRNRIIQEANGYANHVIPMARGEGQQLIIAARGDSASVVSRATGDADRFGAVLAEYKNARSVSRTRLWLETMETVLATVKKYIVDPEGDLDLRFLETRK